MPFELLLYGSTVFLSAFLLFVIQPILGKTILPFFGGSASVWATCLVFFQAGLLAGYLYAHLLIRNLRPRLQAALHSALLLLSFLALPAAEPALLYRYAGGSSAAVLAVLALTAGFPYVVLATTSPLLQAWFARRRGHELPYRLFAVSNLASFAALLLYPVCIEPYLSLPVQVWTWKVGYVLFALLVGLAAAGLARSSAAARLEALEEAAVPNWTLKEAGVWLALSATGSILLIAVTHHLTQNVAPIPFLWVLPLAIYLLTFVAAFGGFWYDSRVFRVMALLAAAVMIAYYVRQTAHPSLRQVLPALAASLLVMCSFCHGELALRKPHPRYLTAFYLIVSLGGVLGGLAAGLGAPALFNGYYELPFGALLCAALVVALWDTLPINRPVVLLAGVGLMGALLVDLQTPKHGVRMMVRNFYGAIQVREVPGDGPQDAVLKLLNGVINHGEQFLAKEKRDQPTTYYGPDSGGGLALRFCEAPGGRRAGLIGLGAGTLAAYGLPHDQVVFFEINPAVVMAARKEFTFVADSQAAIEVKIGDGRLLLREEPAASFDILVVDAFSGDAVPVHLLTTEAFELYFSRLREGGLVALHLSNAYLDLLPVAQAAARAVHAQTRLATTSSDTLRHQNDSTWVLAGKGGCVERPEILERTRDVWDAKNVRPWTDDYSNLLQVLR